MTKRKKGVLERVRVPRPCSASWNEMRSIDKSAARLCEQCEREVHDLSRMTNAEAEDLIGKAKGRVCVRLVRDAGGRMVTKDAESVRTVPTLHYISRRASRIAAAGAFSAALTLSNASAQTVNQSRIGEVSVTSDTSQAESKQGKGALIGTVYDWQEAVIPQAEVVLTILPCEVRETTEKCDVIRATTNEEGQYKFEALPQGTYKIVIKVNGFVPFVKEQVLVLPNKERRVDAVMQVAVVGEIVIVSPAELIFTHEDKISREVNEADDETSESVEDFLQAAEGVDLDELKASLMQGVDVNAINERSETALMFAAKASDEGAKAAVKLLLNAKADVRMQSKFGVTALMFAALNEDASVVRMLIRAGADVSARDVDGRTALMFAALDGNTAAIKVLIAAGADVNAKDNAGKSIFEFGIESDKIEVVNVLKAAGAK